MATQADNKSKISHTDANHSRPKCIHSGQYDNLSSCNKDGIAQTNCGEAMTLSFMEIPKYRCLLQIHGETLNFEFPYPPPNRWWRFWQWLLLGWKWKDCNDH